ncbi:hypothetical protein [Halobacterium sp. R2-5]|uniref:DUF6891 domain-containing protein n=1 Tax=Halobacterium sp. R2-5 TaxID=2715751 RepID=UPI00142375B4|nr:hypothetical protein [Halobacterium sp. R2-5]NIC01028.1 hypothetical protein [Halobacterium sp. R2-5]
MLQKPSTNAVAASNIVLRDHLDDLVGLGPTKLEQLEAKYAQVGSNTGPLTLAEVLRERRDGLLALGPPARKLISNPYVDRFLDDALELLDIDLGYAGYYHPDFNLRARVHGGTCKIETVNPLRCYSLPFRDAMADLRGHSVVTNIGQSGCHSCGGPAIENLVEELEDAGTEVLGAVSFSAQNDPDSPSIGYESFDTMTMSDEDIGHLIAEMLERQQISYDWSGDESQAIQAKIVST